MNKFVQKDFHSQNLVGVSASQQMFAQYDQTFESPITFVSKSRCAHEPLAVTFCSRPLPLHSIREQASEEKYIRLVADTVKIAVSSVKKCLYRRSQLETKRRILIFPKGMDRILD